jgi:hypothetical protein
MFEEGQEQVTARDRSQWREEVRLVLKDIEEDQRFRQCPP